LRCASCPNPFDISLAVVRIPLPPTTPCLFFEQVDELLKARSGAAQALVQDLASSELDTLRAFTTNGFYTTVVDQMTQCLQDIQAADKAGSVLAPALAPALKTSMLELLGMPESPGGLPARLPPNLLLIVVRRRVDSASWKLQTFCAAAPQSSV